MRRQRRVLLCFAFTVAILASIAARAARSSFAIPGGGSLSLNADNFSRDFDKGVVEVSGSVQIIYNQQYLSCDRALIREKTQEIEAYGNLVISSPQAYVEGESAFMNYATNKGVIINGFVKSGQVIFEGKVVRKTGSDTYEAENSYYTACTTCPTGWSFSGSRMNARVGGYAFIKNPVLEIGSVPVLWLPYLIVPLKSERQTGLLIPNLELKTEEFVLGFPFFWAISRSQDTTITLQSHSSRGVKILDNYRYVLSNESQGEANVGFMFRDQTFMKEKIFESRSLGANQNRWFFFYRHEYGLPYDISQKTQINLVSDLWYQRDFSLEAGGRGDPALENRWSLTRNSDTTHSSIDLGYYVNLMKEDPLAGNQDAVHRWPEVRYSGVERSVFGTKLLFNYNINYVNFSRDGFGYDDISIQPDGSRQPNKNRTGPLGGVFNPGVDLIRTGQRLDFRPEISHPMRAGKFLDILPLLQFRHTQYAFNVSTSPQAAIPYDPSPSRQYLRGHLSLRTIFYRVYGRADDALPTLEPEAKSATATNWIDSESRAASEDFEILKRELQRPDSYRHEIQPEMIASYVPYIRRQPENHPFFQQGSQIPIFLEDQPISNSSFTNPNDTVQFDYNDRLSNRTLASFVLTNRLIRRRTRNGPSDYRQVISHKVGQSYDFDEAKRTQHPRVPESDIWSKLDVGLDRFDINSSMRYFPYHRVTTSNSSVKIKNDTGKNYLQIGYYQAFIVGHDPSAVTSPSENISVGLGFTSRYINMVSGLNYNRFQPLDFRLTSWVSDFIIKPPGNCWGIRMYIKQEIGLKPEMRASFDFKFGGETG